MEDAGRKQIHKIWEKKEVFGEIWTKRNICLGTTKLHNNKESTGTGNHAKKEGVEF